MVKLKYSGVRLLENGAPPKPGRLILTHVKVGDECVVFEDERIQIAGSDYTPNQWLELRGRIDRVLVDRGFIEEVGPPKAPWEGQSSSFLTNNTMPILEHKQGYFKSPPWWLRWLYSAVVTKEQYRGDTS